MLHRSVTLAGLLVATGFVTLPCSVQAGTLVSQAEQRFEAAQLNAQPLIVPGNAEPSSNSGALPVDVPNEVEPVPPTVENTPAQTPAQTEIAPATTVQPTLPFISPEFELPRASDAVPKPRYSDEQPLRLEIKLSRRRVTLYRGITPVKTYAIAVGRPGWETPTGTYKVQQMFKNPTWVHPLQKGISIPGGDPDNPLGRYWIGFWTDGKNWIGFHGTPNPKSVGTAASHGCIRMYNKDIEELFQKVSLGTEVKVVR